MHIKTLDKKGNYKEINNDLINQTKQYLDEIAKIQLKFNKTDSDSFINEIKDTIICKYLGFELINTDKHGFDAKLNQNQDIFLEVKNISIHSSSWSATFNDTTFEKADFFKTDKVILAVGVWNYIADLSFIIYGYNQEIGCYLQEKIKYAKLNKRRSTQTLSVRKLLQSFLFCIKPISMTKEQIIKLFKEKYKNKDWINEIKFK